MNYENQDYYYQSKTYDLQDYYQEYYPHEYLGYYYNWIAPLQQWGVKWRPIKDTYSPPLLDTSLQWFHLDPMGMNAQVLLGDGIKKAEEIGATYIYYRQDLDKIEIWAQDITDATIKLSIYLQKVKQNSRRHTHSILKLKKKN